MKNLDNLTIKLSLVIQSHLSDSIIEITLNPKLSEKRLDFIKYLIHNNNDLSVQVTEEYLTKSWELIN